MSELNERKSYRSITLRTASLGLILAACGNTDNGLARIPNVKTAVVEDDLEGQSTAFAYAYGIGLRAGCDSDEFLDDGELISGTEAFAAYELALQKNSQQTAAGFRAGTERGLTEQAARDSDVC